MLAGCSAHGGSGSGAITIAAAGPLTGSAASRGKDLQQAAQMAVDEVNAAGGVNGRHIELKVYDDGDQPSRAHQVAEQIAATPAIAVLGQVASSAAASAGEVYKERRIPAITGAASEARVTENNEWFFRLFRDAGGQGRFLADYARYRFDARQIAVIREKGTAGDEFAAALRDRAKSEGIKIAADQEFTPAEATQAAALAPIEKKLARLPKGTIIVMGTQYAETPAVLRALRDKLGPFTALGYSSIATQELSRACEDGEDTPHPPGYYTDGFNVAAPQLGDVAEYAQTVFASQYKARYGSDPTPEAVRWYEGARLIFQGIAAKGIAGSNSTDDRRRIREWLASLKGPGSAAAGVAGPIYFDKDRNAQRGISVGVFYDGRLMSAPVQFIPVPDSNQVPGWDQLKSGGMVIEAGGKTEAGGKKEASAITYVKPPVVYSASNSIPWITSDVRANTFAADFFLWFRFQDENRIWIHEVEFPTVVSGATLGKKSAGGARTALPRSLTT